MDFIDNNEFWKRVSKVEEQIKNNPENKIFDEKLIDKGLIDFVRGIFQEKK
mgnify:CR=1 FL=1